jgi:hypothetical protein
LLIEWQQPWSALRKSADMPETAVRKTYPSLRQVCLRSAYAADTIPIKHRMASERDGWPGSPLRHAQRHCLPLQRIDLGVQRGYALTLPHTSR